MLNSICDCVYNIFRIFAKNNIQKNVYKYRDNCEIKNKHKIIMKNISKR